MKNLLYVFLFSVVLNGSNNEDISLSTLEMFLFKIGYIALVGEVENEKNNTLSNTKDIEELKNKVEYLLKNSDKKKLNKNSNLLVIKQDENNIKELKKDIEILKKEIKTLSLRIENKSKLKNKNLIKMITNRKAINVRDEPELYGKIIGTLYYGDVVYIESCDINEWCKINGKSEYIAKYLMKR
jgi:hypothetical protein